MSCAAERHREDIAQSGQRKRCLQSRRPHSRRSVVNQTQIFKSRFEAYVNVRQDDKFTALS